MPRGRSRIAPRNPLPKNSACLTCKMRKVKCDGQKPACKACLRTARHEGKDPSECKCIFLIVPPPPPSLKTLVRRRRSVTNEREEHQREEASPTRSESMEDSEEVEDIKPKVEESIEEVDPSPTISPPLNELKPDPVSYPNPQPSPSIPINIPSQYYFHQYPLVEVAASVPYSHYPADREFYSPQSSPEMAFSPPLPYYEEQQQHQQSYSPLFPSYLPQPPPSYEYYSSPPQPRPSPFAKSSHTKDLLNTLAPALDKLGEDEEDVYWSHHHDIEEGPEEEQEVRVDYATFVVGQEVEMGLEW